jgi:hypothetical protein
VNASRVTRPDDVLAAMLHSIEDGERHLRPLLDGPDRRSRRVRELTSRPEICLSQRATVPIEDASVDAHQRKR